MIYKAILVLFGFAVIALYCASKRQKVIDLDGMTYATGQSFRDYSPETKEKYRLPGGDRYVTFDEYQDMLDKQKALYSSSSSQS